MQTPELFARQIGAGRVVRIGEIDEPRARRHARQHLVHIHTQLGLGHNDRNGAVGKRRDPIDEKSMLAEQHLVAHARDDLEQRYTEGVTLVEAWLDGEAPFPERLHISALVAAFSRDLLLLMTRWSEFAEREIKQWPRTDGLGMTRHTRDILQRIVDQQPIISR